MRLALAIAFALVLTCAPASTIASSEEPGTDERCAILAAGFATVTNGATPPCSGPFRPGSI